MSLTFYDNFVDNIAQDSKSYWKEKQQAVISKYYENTTLKTTVEEENVPFDFTFHDVICWVGTVTDTTVNIDKDADDYRNLYFEDINYVCHRGRYYRFDDNYWLVYDSSSSLKTTSDAKVRRCNNWLKWIDRNGNLKEYPCVLHYDLMSPTPQISKTIQTANGHITIIVQGNEDTIKIPYNTRFLLNGVCYKFTTINNYMQNNYVDKDTPLLYFDCYWDALQPDDNLEENIANDTRSKYTIQIEPTELTLTQGSTGQLNAIVTKNGKTIDTSIEWESSNKDVVVIDVDGRYEILGNVDDTATITARVVENKLCTDSVEVKVIASETNNLDIIVSPTFDSIPLYQSQSFTAYLYNDDKKLTDVVDCVAENLNSSYYSLVKNGDNNWTLTNNKQSKTPLTLTFSCRDITKSIEVKLKALF